MEDFSKKIQVTFNRHLHIYKIARLKVLGLKAKTTFYCKYTRMRNNKEPFVCNGFRLYSSKLYKKLRKMLLCVFLFILTLLI